MPYDYKNLLNYLSENSSGSNWYELIEYLDFDPLCITNKYINKNLLMYWLMKIKNKFSTSSPFVYLNIFFDNFKNVKLWLIVNCIGK